VPADWFESAYAETPPWDIGRPQPAIVRLAESGQIAGRVLDVGCGTGENIMYLAESGLAATGIDGAPTAIRKAKAKAKRRGLQVRFEVADALDLPVPEQPYDTIIDSGLFHVFSDEERGRFRDSLGRVIRPGGTYYLMCFSDAQPGDWGPRRVRQAEIRSVFRDGWRVDSIQPSAFDTNIGQAHAWLASISRLRLAEPAIARGAPR
jgi:cyclopropane fatty-acyl-phospholipid synthase-like methyltransferase